MHTQLAFSDLAEIAATAQEVRRDDDGTVRIMLTPHGAAPCGHWRLRFAEPVSVTAGERVIIRTGWPAIDEQRCQSWVMPGDATVTSVLG